MLVLIATLSIVFEFARAHADSCQNPHIEKCRVQMTNTVGRADQATANISGGEGARDAATAQQQAFLTIQRGWEEVVQRCTEIQERCQGQCAESGDCKDQIDKIIKFADAKASENGQSAASALQNASMQDDAEAHEERELATVQKTSGESNLDALRRLQRTHDCTQSGAGSETKCVDGQGNTVYVPSGPDDAFRNFKAPRGI